MKKMLFVILMLPLTSFALDESLFGIKLGDDISKYPSCESDEGLQKICVYPVREGRSDKDRLIELRPGKPKWLTSNIWTTVKNGKISELMIRTGGAEVQEDVFGYLKLKFGKKPDVKITSLQNSFGAQFKSIEAQWSLKNGDSVFMTGIDEKIDEGTVMLMSSPSK